MNKIYNTKSINLLKYFIYFFIVASLMTLMGCAANTANIGRLAYSNEVTQTFESYTVLENHNYYYSGPDTYPMAVVAIHTDYRLDSRLWKPIDMTPEQLRKWLSYRTVRVGYSGSTYGSTILGPDNQVIGAWYSIQDWRDEGWVKVFADNRIMVSTPVVNPNQRQTFFDQTVSNEPRTDRVIGNSVK